MDKVIELHTLAHTQALELDDRVKLVVWTHILPHCRETNTLAPFRYNSKGEVSSSRNAESCLKMAVC